jgi:hypothetical protein
MHPRVKSPSGHMQTNRDFDAYLALGGFKSPEPKPFPASTTGRRIRDRASGTPGSTVNNDVRSFGDGGGVPSSVVLDRQCDRCMQVRYGIRVDRVSYRPSPSSLVDVVCSMQWYKRKAPRSSITPPVLGVCGPLFEKRGPGRSLRRMRGVTTYGSGCTC